MKKKSQDRSSPYEHVLLQIAAKEGIENKVIVNQKSESYPPTKYCTYLRFELSGERKLLSVVLKLAQQDPELRTKFQVREKFLNEIYFYSQANTKIRPILDEWNSDEEHSSVHIFVPNYYGHDPTDGKEWLVIEDVGTTEFVNLGNFEDLDKFHAKAGIQALAAFHSASLHWKAANPNEFMTVAKLFTETEMLRLDEDPTQDTKKKKIDAALGAACRTTSVHLSGPYTACMEKICNEGFADSPSWVSMEKSEPWSVITHGDCWAKNFLFKYDKNKKIAGVALVDFKCARAASPLLDVTNFLLSSGSSDCLKDLRPFLEKHKNSMNPKMTDYRQHVRLFGCYGLVAAVIHHYYNVLHKSLDVDAATLRILALEEMKTSTHDTPPPQDKQSDGNETADRVSLVVRAAHDLRLI